MKRRLKKITVRIFLMLTILSLTLAFGQEDLPKTVKPEASCLTGEEVAAGCSGKGNRRGGPINFEDCFIRGFRSYGRKQWRECIAHMTHARELCAVESGAAVKFNSRDYVSYLPTLYLWAAAYHCEKGDPYLLLIFWRAFFNDKWDLACFENPDWRAFRERETIELRARWSGRVQQQLEDLALGLGTVNPRSARGLCRKLLDILAEHLAGRLELDDETVWARLASEEGYAWPPKHRPLQTHDQDRGGSGLPILGDATKEAP